jgi:hypothetical protein
MRQSWRVPETPRKPRVAILILAHAYPTLLDSLVRRLSPDFDIYLHLDRATDITLESFAWAKTVTTVKSRRTYWGSFKVTLAILDLLRQAHARGYDRYVLISGQDVPLVSNKEIVQFFSRNQQIDYLQSIPMSDSSVDATIERITRRYWQAPYRHAGLSRALYSVVEYALELGYRSFLQKKVLAGEYYWGETWFGIRHSTATAILSYLEQTPEFVRLFAGSRLAEESFLQTAVRRISSKTTLSDHLLTYTDWITGPEKPRVLEGIDLKRLTESGFLFARKVHPEKSKELLAVFYEANAPG